MKKTLLVAVLVYVVIVFLAATSDARPDRRGNPNATETTAQSMTINPTAPNALAAVAGVPSEVRE